MTRWGSHAGRRWDRRVPRPHNSSRYPTPARAAGDVCRSVKSRHWSSALSFQRPLYEGDWSSQRANIDTIDWANFRMTMDVHITLGQRGDLSVQIYRQLLSAILDGRLRPGERLPPTRELAQRLGVSRNTVAVAYE